jgi:dTDP-4-amino-4,6-dideoxygalactose transaminase
MSAPDHWPALLGGRPAVPADAPRFRWPPVGPHERAAVTAVLDAGMLSYPRCEGAVREFEIAFCAHLGARHGITTHSGTAALYAAYFALDLLPGAEVIVPAYTHIGTALPLLHLGLRPVLCDVDATTGNARARDVAAVSGAGTGAIAVTHQFGLSCEMDEIRALARNRWPIVEDCSHAHGATYRGRPVGVDGDVACFSLQAHKTISAGEGGILVTGDAGIAERAALSGHFREVREFTGEFGRTIAETGFGLKSRLHPLGAALALEGLRRLREVCAARAANHGALSSAVDEIPGIRTLPTPTHCDRGGHFRFVLHFEPEAFMGMSGEQICRALHAEGAVEFRPGSLARPLHSYRIFQDAQVSPSRGLHAATGGKARAIYRPGDFPNAESFSARTLQLPAFTEPSSTLLQAYARALGKIQRHAGDLRLSFAKSETA